MFCAIGAIKFFTSSAQERQRFSKVALTAKTPPNIDYLLLLIVLPFICRSLVCEHSFEGCVW